jgi:hypothetical protein
MSIAAEAMIRLLRIVSSLITFDSIRYSDHYCDNQRLFAGQRRPHPGEWRTALINIKTLFLFAKQYPEIADHNCEQH